MNKPTKNPSNSSKKRKYHNNRGSGGSHATPAQHNKKWSSPKRGGPGILLTCETGQERKCQNEGVQILSYYLSKAESSQSGNGRDEEGSEGGGGPLTLEEELKMLKSKKGWKKSGPSSAAFGVYETGCRGSVFVLCTLPNCHLIPPIQTEYMQMKSDDKIQTSTETDDGIQEGNDVNDDSGKDGTTEVSKKPRINDEEKEGRRALTTSASTPTGLQNAGKSAPSIPNSWDPIAAVQSVIADLDAKSRKAPSSRFVTRMIPIQATCFASLEEIRLTSAELLKIYLPPNTKTFAVAPKRRHCDSLSRDQIIDTVAGSVLELIPACKVQLEKPDATIVVEICKNICGISVVEDYGRYRNFNLFSAKEE